MNQREFEQKLKEAEAHREWLAQLTGTTGSDEEYEPDPEEQLICACSLLEDAMRLLGFYGDKKVSAVITVSDRQAMTKAADEIKAFLTQSEV